MRPDLAVGPDDSLGLAYYTRAIVDNTVQNRRITFLRSTNGGTSFSSPVFLSSAAGQAYVPAVAFEPSGAIDVVWEEFDAGDVQSDVFVSRSTDGGATFSAPANLSANGGFSGSPANPWTAIGGPGRAAVSAGANGTLVVSWSDDTGSAVDLLLSTPRAAVLSNRPPVVSITSPAPGAMFEAGDPVRLHGFGDGPGRRCRHALLELRRRPHGDRAASPAPHAYARARRVPRDAHRARHERRSRDGLAHGQRDDAGCPASATRASSCPSVLEAAGVGGSHYTSEVTLVSRAGAADGRLPLLHGVRGCGHGLRDA